jgi:hypothetical protein
MMDVSILDRFRGVVAAGILLFMGGSAAWGTPDIAIYNGASTDPAHERWVVDPYPKVTLNFGESAEIQFTIRNNGTTPLTGLALEVEGRSSPDYTVAPLAQSTLAPGESTLLSMTYTPVTYGKSDIVLNIFSNDPDEPRFWIDFFNHCTSPVVQVRQDQDIVYPGNSRRYDFGGAGAGSGVTREFTLRNLGDGSLRLTGTPLVEISGANAGDFVVTAQPTDFLPALVDTAVLKENFEILPPSLFDSYRMGVNLPNLIRFTNGSGVAWEHASMLLRPCPDGKQAAFFYGELAEGVPEMVRNFNFTQTGEYLVRYSMANCQPAIGRFLDVSMDGVQINGPQGATFPDTNWRSYAIPYTCTSTGNHVLGVRGTSLPGYGTVLDRVEIIPVNVPPSATTFSVRFAPTTAGPREAVLRIYTNEPGLSPYIVNLDGTGTGVSGPDIAVFNGDTTAPGSERTDNANPFPAGNRNLGEGSHTHTFTLKNAGYQTLSGLALTLSGGGAGSYAHTPLAVTSLAPGESTTVDVTFTPTALSVQAATLSITSNDTDESPFEIPLAGQGTIPLMEVEQNTAIASGGNLDFGGTTIGGTSTQRTFRILNLGDGELKLTGTPAVQISGAHATDFTVVYQPTATLAGAPVETGANDGFETPALSAPGYSYNTAGTGWTLGGQTGLARNGSPWFVNPAPEGWQTAFLQTPNATPSSVSRSVTFGGLGDFRVRFFMVRRGGGYEGNDVEVRVGGGLIGTVNHTELPGDTWRMFALPYHNSSMTGQGVSFRAVRTGGDYASILDRVEFVNAGSLAAASFAVSFTPRAGGTRAATLAIPSNDPARGTYLIQLSGTGQGPEIAVEEPAGSALASGGSRNFGARDLGTATDVTFTLRNLGSSPVTLSDTPAVGIGGSHAADFSVVSPPATPVAAGGGTAFTIRFTPSEFGTRSAVATIGSNDPDESPYQIILAGFGHRSLAAWRQLHFGSSANTGNGANGNDYEKDGWLNIVEYALGWGPTVPNGAWPAGFYTQGSGGLTFQFTPGPGVTGISFGAEMAPDLGTQDWEPVPDSGVPPQHSFTLPVLPGEPQMYLRLTFEEVLP